MTIHLHDGDLPGDVAGDLEAADSVAVDTETQGLDLRRDRLCLVQLSTGDGDAHLVRIAAAAPAGGAGAAPNLAALLGRPGTLKLFHYARFDAAVLRHRLGADAAPLYCTKIASRLARTYTDRHGLRDLCRDLLGIDLSKQQQSSDWGAPTLSRQQLDYAAADVLYLHELRRLLDGMLERAGRAGLAQRCFAAVPIMAALDLAGWDATEVFSH